jgi:hypothetical protein
MKRRINWEGELGDYEKKDKLGEDETKNERKKNWGRLNEK